MYRRIVVYNSEFISGPVNVLYHARGARPLSEWRLIGGPYDANMQNAPEMFPVIFDDSILVRVNTGIGRNHMYAFAVDVAENQPVKESVEETTKTGSAIVVFNENGVVVCRNGVNPPVISAPAQTVSPGEMTSEPIDGTGEMTSEPVDGIGETTSEPIEATDAMI